MTGFAIGYNIDRPTTRLSTPTPAQRPADRQAADLVLPGPPSVVATPGLENNPLTITQDPEFQALNPGLPVTSQEAGATLQLSPTPPTCSSR